MDQEGIILLDLFYVRIKVRDGSLYVGTGPMFALTWSKCYSHSLVVYSQSVDGYSHQWIIYSHLAEVYSHSEGLLSFVGNLFSVGDDLLSVEMVDGYDQ